MPSSYSDNLKIELIATGEKATTWGDITNTNLGTALEEAICGSADVTFASNDVTLTLTNNNTTQAARNIYLDLVGTTGGAARTLTLPDIEKPYIIKNSCSDDITISNSSGTTVLARSGRTIWVYSTGSGVKEAINHLAVGATIATSTNQIVGSTSSITLTNKTLTDCVANTQPAGNNTTRLATTAFVQQELDGTGYVDTAQLAENAVTNLKIASSAVDTLELANGAVTGPKIEAGAVSGTKILDGSVDTSELADNAVTTAKIADSNVTTAKITDANITLAKMADNSIGTNQIIDLSVGTDQLAATSVSTAKLQNSAVNSNKLADNAVTTAKIADDAVTTAKIATTGVTAATYGDSSTNKIPVVTVNAEGQVTSASEYTAPTAPSITYDDITLTNVAMGAGWNFPGNIFAINGHVFIGMGNNSGGRLDIEFYDALNAGGTLLATVKVAGGNENNGADGGSGLTVSSSFTVIVPTGAKSLKFVKGTGGTDPVLESTFHVLKYTGYSSGTG